MNTLNLIGRSGELLKADLEVWYYRHRFLKNYFKIILLTALGIVKADLAVLHRFDDLPPVPEELEGIIQ